MTKDVNNLLATYEKRKSEIKKRIEEFKNVLNENDQRIFAELAFCLCTPQSKATAAWNAISSLTKNGLLFSENEEKIAPFLNAVRFNENKARHIVSARKMFTKDGELKIKEILPANLSQSETRKWLVENVVGLGMKEASHFLRNVGLGNELAILDRHILKNLKEYGATDEIPKTLTLI